jgi:hypothetical protein
MNSFNFLSERYKHNISLKSAVPGPDFKAHPLYISERSHVLVVYKKRSLQGTF